MRKYKQVKEKKVTYSLPEWEIVENRAAKLNMKTGTYIRKISVDGELYYCDLEKAAPLLNGLRSISNSMNQIARKANEINSIYAGDVEKLRSEVTNLCHTLNAFLSTRQWTKV